MKKPIRILHIVSSMDIGGIETMLMNYYRRLDRRKVQFDFLEHRSRGYYDSEIESYGGKICQISAPNPFSPHYRLELMRFFNNHSEYQIVHAHMNCMSSLPLYYAKKAGVPVRISHAHNTDTPHNVKYPIKIYWKYKIPNVATDLFACSAEAGKWMFNGNSFLVLHNAIITERFLFDETKRENVRKRLQLEDSFLVGHVGNFIKQKNHVFLLKIFREIIRMRRNAKLLLVGEGHLQYQIQCLAKKYGLSDAVVFYGMSDNVGELLSAMDVFVLPSFYEGLPVALVEAQASGLKCYVSDVISDGGDVTNNVERIGLKEKPSIWASRIIVSGNHYNRFGRGEDIIRGRYDISENVRWLENYYLKKWKRN